MEEVTLRAFCQKGRLHNVRSHTGWVMADKWVKHKFFSLELSVHETYYYISGILFLLLVALFMLFQFRFR